MTYPLYLYHEVVLILALTFTTGYSYSILILSMIASLAFAAAMTAAIDPTISRFRDRVRGVRLATTCGPTRDAGGACRGERKIHGYRVIRNLRQLKPMALSLNRKPEDGIFWWAVFCILLQFFFANNVVHAIVGHSVNMRVHPANIIILFCAIYVLLRGGMSFHERCRQSPGLVLYVFGIPLFSLYTIYFNGLSGAAFYWDSFWGPGLLAMVLQGATDKHKRLLAKIMMAIVIFNVLFGLYESMTQDNLLPFVADDDIKETLSTTDFRANAFYPHPLTASFITAIAFFLLYAMQARFIVLAPSFVLLLVGLLAFGGRTALFVTIGLSGVAAFWIVLSGFVKRNLKLSTMGYLLMAVIVLPVVFGVIVTQTSIAERIMDTLYYDDSAEVRVIQWAVLNRLSLKNWMFGVPLLELEAMKYQIGLKDAVEDIENFWLLLFLNLGVIGFIPFLIVFGLFLKYIAQLGGRLFGWLLMLTALIIDSGSNSLGTKSNDLFIEVAFLMAMSGFRNYVRQPRARRYKPTVKFRPPQRALADGANHWSATA